MSWKCFQFHPCDLAFGEFHQLETELQQSGFMQLCVKIKLPCRQQGFWLLCQKLLKQCVTHTGAVFCLIFLFINSPVFCSVESENECLSLEKQLYFKGYL